MFDRIKANRVLKTVLTEENLQKVHDCKRVINEKKVHSFNTILNNVIKDNAGNPNITIRHAMCDAINPLSGFISIVGTAIRFNLTKEIQDAISDISYVIVEESEEGETSVQIGFYNIIELVMGE